MPPQTFLSRLSLDRVRRWLRGTPAIRRLGAPFSAQRLALRVMRTLNVRFGRARPSLSSGVGRACPATRRKAHVGLGPRKSLRQLERPKERAAGRARAVLELCAILRPPVRRACGDRHGSFAAATLRSRRSSTGPRLLFCRRRPFCLACRSTGCGGGLRGTPAIRSHLHSALPWGFSIQCRTSATPGRPPPLSPDGR